MPIVYTTDESKLAAQKSVKRLVWSCVDALPAEECKEAGSSWERFSQSFRRATKTWREGPVQEQQEEMIPTALPESAPNPSLSSSASPSSSSSSTCDDEARWIEMAQGAKKSDKNDKGETNRIPEALI